jgi:hypothetical protein
LAYQVQLVMYITEKAKIFKNIWSCAFRRRYNAKVKKNWELYYREHETIMMCLKMKNARWWTFDTEKTKHFGVY